MVVPGFNLICRKTLTFLCRTLDNSVDFLTAITMSCIHILIVTHHEFSR